MKVHGSCKRSVLGIAILVAQVEDARSYIHLGEKTPMQSQVVSFPEAPTMLRTRARDPETVPPSRQDLSRQVFYATLTSVS